MTELDQIKGYGPVDSQYNKNLLNQQKKEAEFVALIETMKLRISYSLVREVKAPCRANPFDAGMDFFIPEGLDALDYTIPPGKDVCIPSGVKINVPEGWALTFFNKSSKAVHNKLMVGAQVVDHGYQGEVHLHVFNLSDKEFELVPGQKLVQGLFMSVPDLDLVCVGVDELFTETSNRGAGGFGSTGL